MNEEVLQAAKRGHKSRDDSDMETFLEYQKEALSQNKASIKKSK